jgi:hypothetical protein
MKQVELVVKGAKKLLTLDMTDNPLPTGRQALQRDVIQDP